MAGKYRAYYQQKNKKNNNSMLMFYFLGVIGLLFAILLVSGKMESLKERLAQLNKKEPVETPEIQESIGPIDQIRVVLLSEDQDSIWNGVHVSSAGEEITYTQENWGENPQMLTISSQNAPVYLGEGEKPCGDIAYPGTIEIHKTDQGLMVVNQVSLEEYLTRVLPSEMPQSYGLEALKAQAVCARSYVYVQARETNYPQVNASIDDSTAFQVYNRKMQNDLSNQAVAETTHLVLMKDDRLVEALYYSTSCGYTMSGEIFHKDASYLAPVYVGDSAPDLSFDTYITAGDEHAYENQEKYFRWKVTLNPEAYKDSYGTLKSMKCLKRNPGGDIEKLQVKFEKEKKTIEEELEIRKFLGPMMNQVSFNDQTTERVNPAAAVLYSSAFVCQKEGESFVLYGGGFGHGAGMSQNGAKALAAHGMTFDQILSFFYKEVTLQDITRLP